MLGKFESSYTSSERRNVAISGGFDGSGDDGDIINRNDNCNLGQNFFILGFSFIKYFIFLVLRFIN